MKMLVGLIIMFASGVYAADSYRTFTAQDGRTLKARILQFDATSGKIQIEREDKKKVTVPSSSFSDKDQKYIEKWHVAQTFMSDSKFKLDIEREEVKTVKKEHEVDIGEEFGGGRRGGDSGVIVVAIDKNTQYKYKLFLDNKSDVPLKNIIMEYRIFYEQQKPELDEKANKNRPEGSPLPERYLAVDQNKIKDEKVRIKPIEPKTNQELSTATVTLTSPSTFDWDLS